VVEYNGPGPKLSDGDTALCSEAMLWKGKEMSVTSRSLLLVMIMTVLVLTVLATSPSRVVATERDPIIVDTFRSEFINWATVHQDTFQFPPPALYEQVNCLITIACPVPPADCDPWDRFGNLRLRHYVNDTEFVDYEIARFITPYDITFGGGPQTCTWIVDATDYQFLLHDEVILRLYIESWMGNDNGWLMTITFEMLPGTPEREPFAIQKLWGPGNLIYGDPDNPAVAHLQPVDVELPQQASWAKFRTYATGHGFNNTDNAAEFSYKWHKVQAGVNAAQHYLWRPDCESNPCSPQLGTWQYDRAGWCPGDKADPWDIDVTDWFTPGEPSEFRYTLQPYENWCRPTNPDCQSGGGCNCDTHAYFKFEAQVIFFRVPNPTGVLGADLPAQLHLVGNYPNPFNPRTTIAYHLATPCAVTVTVYDAGGALMQSFDQTHATAGTYQWTWNGRDQDGIPAPAGVYLYEVRCGEERVAAKMLLLK